MIFEEINNSDGQAIFETVLFMPVLLFFLVVMLNVGNAINASINQQKATRAYTYYLLKGNSQGQRSSDLDRMSSSGLENVSNFIVGWRVKDEGDSDSFGSVYKLPSFPGAKVESEDCFEPTEDVATSCIKIFTMYGLCGESFYRDGTGVLYKTDDADGGPSGASKTCSFQ